MKQDPIRLPICSKANKNILERNCSQNIIGLSEKRPVMRGIKSNLNLLQISQTDGVPALNTSSSNQTVGDQKLIMQDNQTKSERQKAQAKGKDTDLQNTFSDRVQNNLKYKLRKPSCPQVFSSASNQYSMQTSSGQNTCTTNSTLNQNWISCKHDKGQNKV